jgi:hypothetical protein
MQRAIARRFNLPFALKRDLHPRSGRIFIPVMDHFPEWEREAVYPLYGTRRAVEPVLRFSGSPVHWIILNNMDGNVAVRIT